MSVRGVSATYSTVTDIVLAAGAGVQRTTPGDATPTEIVSNASNKTSTGNSGSNVMRDGGSGNDWMGGGSLCLSRFWGTAMAADVSRTAARSPGLRHRATCLLPHQL